MTKIHDKFLSIMVWTGVRFVHITALVQIRIADILRILCFFTWECDFFCKFHEYTQIFGLDIRDA